ncbi:MAG: hypothetical protein MR372_01200 [Lachnospiraceae bacterium]|nr:hypothetical protein [Lachnospiraceae bacterium]MDY6222200.1 hypothetical protein [Candidatus Alectryocaccobium sp.]
MKKKIIIAVCTALMAVSLAGCGGNTSTKISSSVAMANPWEDFKTLEEAQEKVGFEISLPEDWAKKDAVYRVCEGLNAIEVRFDEGDEVIRKAKDDGDISGDYNEYASEETMTIGEAQVTFKGTSEDEVNLAVWVSGDYSYSVSSTDAVSADQMKKIVEAVK